MSADNREIPQDVRDRYWAKTRNLTVIILILWFIFSIVVPLMVRPLNEITFMGFPLGFYMICQGSLIAFVLLVFFQNWRQDQIDDEFGVGD